MCIGLFFCIYKFNFLSVIFITFSSSSVFMTLKYYNIVCNNIYFGLHVLFNHFPLFAFLLFIVFVCHAYSVAQSYLTFSTWWALTHQAPLSMGFSKQEYWIGLQFPTQGSSWTQDQTHVSCIGRQFFFFWLSHLGSPFVYHVHAWKINIWFLNLKIPN